MITVRNNTLETSTSKAKSKRNFHPLDARRELPSKKQLIIDFIKQTIVQKGKCTFSQSTIAEMFNVTRKYVNFVYKELKEDPSFRIVTFKIKPIKNHTCIVNFVFLLCLLLSVNVSPLGFNKNYIFNSYITDTKKSDIDYESLKKEQLSTNVHKLFYDAEHPGDIFTKPQKREVSKTMHDDEAQPRFEKKESISSRSNVSAYNSYIHIERHIPGVSQDEALKKVVEMANNPFFSLMSKQEAAEILGNIMEQMMEDKSR